LREAEAALHRTVQISRVHLTLRAGTSALFSVAYSSDGRRRAIVASPIDHSDLSWALRVGDDNSVVATSFALALHEVGALLGGTSARFAMRNTARSCQSCG
jgi:hypothetical protein